MGSGAAWQSSLPLLSVWFVYLFAVVFMLGIGSRFQVGIVAMVVEMTGATAAMRRGFRLTKTRWMAFGAVQGAMLLVSYLVMFIPTALVFSRASDAGSRPTYGAIAAFVASLIFIVWWIPVYTGLGVAMYVDGRVRLEAIDLEHLSDELSTGWSPASTSL